MLMVIADMMIVYIGESLQLQVENGLPPWRSSLCRNDRHLAGVWLYDASDRINKVSRMPLVPFSEGDEQRLLLMGLKRLPKLSPR